MKRLYVGCRVRLVRPVHAENYGRTGRILRIFDEEKTICGHSINCVCGWDGPVIGDASHTDQLEPIQDPGHQVISWEEMAGLWTPEKVGA